MDTLSIVIFVIKFGIGNNACLTLHVELHPTCQDMFSTWTLREQTEFSKMGLAVNRMDGQLLSLNLLKNRPKVV